MINKGKTKSAPRLHVTQVLGRGRDIALDREQGHYLAHVLRLRSGDAVRVFNGRDGEFLAFLTDITKKTVNMRCERRVAEVQPPPDIDYVFAPLKHSRLDYLVQKATELGARRLRPVITARTIAGRVNLERMKANAIEAAEQCNLVYVPEILEPEPLAQILAQWDDARKLIHCDETAANENPIVVLSGLAPPAAVLVGPEGGFTEEERRYLKALPYTVSVSLGPRIMRADTVAISALALVQAAIGDWGNKQET